MSERGRAAAQKILYPHRLGSGGYATARRKKWNPDVVIAPSEPSGTPISAELGGRSRDWMLARAKSIVDGVAVIDDPTILEVQKRVVRILNLMVNFKLNANASELFDKLESSGLLTNLTQLIIAGRKNKRGE